MKLAYASTIGSNQYIMLHPSILRPSILNYMFNTRRLILLHQFSDLYCPITPLVNLKEDCVTVCLRKILIPRSKDSVFRKNIQMTMMRDKSHGPVIELNRYQVQAVHMFSCV